MHNPKSVLENETHKLLYDFVVQTNHLFSARRPDLVIINNKKKRTCRIVDFAVPAGHKVKLKEKKDKNLVRELKKLWNMKVMVIPIVIDALGTITKELIQVLENLRIRGWVQTNYSIIEIGQNTEKSPGDLRRLAVTQTPV